MVFLPSLWHNQELDSASVHLQGLICSVSTASMTFMSLVEALG